MNQPVFRGFNLAGRGVEGNCHICGWPKTEQGAGACSYPHAMVPVEEVSPGMWAWEPVQDAPAKDQDPASGVF